LTETAVKKSHQNLTPIKQYGGPFSCYGPYPKPTELTSSCLIYSAQIVVPHLKRNNIINTLEKVLKPRYPRSDAEAIPLLDQRTKLVNIDEYPQMPGFAGHQE
jgi:hypothetical protein